MTHYGVFIVKAGETYSLYGPPSALPERAQFSQYADGGQNDAIVAINKSGALSGTTFSLAALNRYWNPADNSLTAIIAGSYWVGVVAMNQSALDPDLRMSKITWTAAAVTVA